MTTTQQPDWFHSRPPPPKKVTPPPRPKLAKPPKVEYTNSEITEDETWLRHTNWTETRGKVRQALADAGTSPMGMINYDNCGADCVIEWSPTKKQYRCKASFCHCRHCQPCAKAKSALITGNLREILRKQPKAIHRFITLTLLHSNTPLKGQIKRLYASYAKLRKTKEWKSTQHGGAATLEIKFNPDSKKWHPHLHIISQGDYLATKRLSELWLAATGDSFIVDIRIISQEKDVAYYVGKYVTKGTNADVWEDREVAKEWVLAVKGVRMCATFGKWRGYKLLKKPEDPGDWKEIAPFHRIANAARRHEPWALAILTNLVSEHQYNPGKTRTPKKTE